MDDLLGMLYRDDDSQSIPCRGEKALIASILLQAIDDGGLVKKPRPPNLRNSDRDRKITFDKRYLLLAATIEFLCNICCDHFLKLNTYYPYFIIKIIISVKFNKFGEREKIAWEGRSFFNPKNKAYNIYCNWIDICPIYLAEKAKKYFDGVDKGKRRRIDIKI